MATTKAETNPKRRQSKTTTDQNGDNPKRRQTKTVTLQDDDNQNGDNLKRQPAKTATRQNGERHAPFWYVTVLNLSLFWCVAVLDTTKTPTNSRRHFGEKSSWICRRFSCHRFGSVAILVVAVFDLSPF